MASSLVRKLSCVILMNRRREIKSSLIYPCGALINKKSKCFSQWIDNAQALDVWKPCLCVWCTMQHWHPAFILPSSCQSDVHNLWLGLAKFALQYHSVPSPWVIACLFLLYSWETGLELPGHLLSFLCEQRVSKQSLSMVWFGNLTCNPAFAGTLTTWTWTIVHRRDMACFSVSFDAGCVCCLPLSNASISCQCLLVWDNAWHQIIAQTQESLLVMGLNSQLTKYSFNDIAKPNIYAGDWFYFHYNATKSTY